MANKLWNISVPGHENDPSVVRFCESVEEILHGDEKIRKEIEDMLEKGFTQAVHGWRKV